ncbi:hypothetical protein DRQ33_03350 [bacterium]|nr:MAG: hypothetical protein DRQ33_03350 [bacterium]
MAEKFREKISRMLTADLHCDVLSSVKNGWTLINGRNSGHFDLPRMERGGISCQVLSIFVHPRWIPEKLWWKKVNRQLAILDDALKSASDRLRLTRTPQEWMENHSDGIKSVILEIEGLHPIEKNPDRLAQLWDKGVRIFTLTWNNSNRFAHSSMDDQSKGITPDGKEIVNQINQMGGIIDASHSSDRTFYDLLEMGISPMLSHSCVRELKDSSRNITLDMIEKLGQANGIIGINFFPGFLSSKKYKQVSLGDLIAHIDKVMEVSSEKVPALGSDFDGVRALPSEIHDAEDFWKIAFFMHENNYNSNVIENVMGKNFFHFWKSRSNNGNI